MWDRILAENSPLCFLNPVPIIFNKSENNPRSCMNIIWPTYRILVKSTIYYGMVSMTDVFVFQEAGAAWVDGHE